MDNCAAWMLQSGNYESMCQNGILADAMELTDNGKISKENYINWISCLLENSDDCEMSFLIVDNNNKGEITPQQLNTAFANYWFMANPRSPFNDLFGAIDGEQFEQLSVAFTPRTKDLFAFPTKDNNLDKAKDVHE